MATRKLPADHRIDEIVDAVEASILRDRTLAFGMNQVATEIGSSRALIYVYFDSVPAIIDEVCRRHLTDLIDRLRAAGGQGEVRARAAALGRSYLDYLVARGPALRYILRDAERNGRLENSRPILRRLIRSLVGEARSLLRVEWREASVMIELLMAIPDTLARQLREQVIDLTIAHETCDRLITDLVADLRVVR